MPQDNKDIDHVYKVIDKLDLAIDKLADVSSDIKQILAVHETRLDQSEAGISSLISMGVHLPGITG